MFLKLLLLFLPLQFFVSDDDLSSSTGYHNALPIEVHGAGYAQMAMVSNAKAMRLVLLTK